MGLVLQVRAVLVAKTISNIGAVGIALATATCYVSLAIAVASTWRFPVPFGSAISPLPMVVFFTAFTLLAIGPRLLANSPTVRQQIKAQLVVVASQGIVGFVYPCFSVTFMHLSGVRQTVFVLTMPVIKSVVKQIVASAAKDLEEHVAHIVVFSVDVFNAFYVAICLQVATTRATQLCVIATDIFYVVAAIRAIFRRAQVVQVKKEFGFEFDSPLSQPVNYLHELPVMVRNVFPGALSGRSRGRPIRVFAPFPLRLTAESIAFINEIAGSRRQSHVYSSSQVLASSTASFKSYKEASDGNTARQVTTIVVSIASHGATKMNQVSPSSFASFRKGSTPRRLLTFRRSEADFASATALRAALARRATEKAVWDALEALFHSEYLLLAEYIKSMIPMLYIVYLAILYHLPVAAYYPQTAALTSDKLLATLASVAGFALVEFVGFGALLIVLRRKFRFSPLHQLAFVLETHAAAVQGHLFLWTIYIVHMMLRHYGVSFRVQALFSSTQPITNQ